MGRIRTPWAPLRADISKTGLKLGTALGGALAVTLLMSPHGAQAQDVCGAPVDSQVVCAATGSPYEDGVRYAATGPEDLTIVLEEGTAIGTVADGATGVDVAGEGSVTVSGSGATVSTGGAGAGGVKATSASGAVDVVLGSVTTQGGASTGIFASTNYNPEAGNVTVAVGDVITYGDASTGIRAETYNGDIDITAAVVLTLGVGSDGIYAAANGGSATVTAGSVLTTGTGGRGITVFSEGTTTIIADDVTTVAEGPYPDLDAGGIKAVGTAVSVTVGTVATVGDYSAGIYANSNHVVSDASLVNPLIEVTAGRVDTEGYQSHGVVALNFAEGGTSAITVDRVTTTGDSAFGVYGLSYGDVVMDLGTIVTSGVGSTAVGATSIEGDIGLSVDTVSTTGMGSGGIDTKNYSYDGRTIIAFGDIRTRRDYARGILAISNGDISITGGQIATNGFASGGVSAVSYLGDITISGESIVTGGDVSNAVNAAGNGAIDIEIDKIATAGNQSAGVYAAAYGLGDITINVGDVVTAGSNSIGVGGRGFGFGAVEITANSIKTSGIGSSGVVGRAVSNDLRVDVKSIETTGDGANGRGSIGATLDVGEGNLEARFGSITTSGDRAVGIISSVDNGKEHITITDSLRTSGDYSLGMLVVGVQSEVILDVFGAVSTSGDRAKGISAQVLIGTATLNAAGAVTTSGADATAIDVSAFSFGSPPDPVYGGTEPYIYDATVDIAANTVTTTGDRSDGIRVSNDHQYAYGDSPTITNRISVTTGTVAVSGAGSVGLRVEARQGVDLDLGATSSIQDNAVLVSAGGQADLQLRGATVSGTTDAVVVTAKDIALSILKTGGVQGAANGLVLSASGVDLVHPDSISEPFGQIIVDNAGVLSGGEGNALVVTEGQLRLLNSGTIRGGLALADGADTVDNTGVFVADKDSDFGAGVDLFTNTGAVTFATANRAVSVAFRGLERFDNRGLIDLRNGVTGDSLTLFGDYVGSGKAQLGLDIGTTGADRLTILGAATGSTGILLAGLDGAGAILTGATPIALVQAGAGSTADAFHIETADIGLVHYGLTYDPGRLSYSLVSEAGASVHRSLKYGEGLQTAAEASVDAIGSSLANQRSTLWATGDEPGRIWVQAFGAKIGRDASATLSGDDLSLDYDQDLQGGQTGVTLATRSVQGALATFGVTGGYVTSDVNFDQTAQSADLKTLNLGVYAAATRGPVFVNGLVKYDWHSVDVRDRDAGYSVSLDGTSIGARLEAGARLGSTGLSFEPVVSLSWMNTRLDDLGALGQTIQFDDLESLTSRIGGTVSGRRITASGGTLIFTAGLAAAYAFEGDERATFLSGGVSQSVEDSPADAWGEASVGVSYITDKALTLFLEGQGDFGDDRSGGAVRVGARFSF